MRWFSGLLSRFKTRRMPPRDKGEAVPKTPAAARKIAKKGKGLLASAKRRKATRPARKTKSR